MTLPALFVAHGSPALAVEDNAYTSFLGELGTKLPRPRGIVVFSAHWDSPDQRLTVDESHETLHDFYGFPEEVYRVNYPAKGDAALSDEIARLFSEHNLPYQPILGRGLDHGAWVVLKHMYPDADIPVILLSVDSRRSPEEQYEIGRMLAALRDQDILVVGSGGLVHNLRLLSRENEPLEWAEQFDQWIEEQLQSWNLKNLFNYAKKAPHALEAVPSYAAEHFIPFFYALGTADRERQAKKLYQEYQLGSLSLNCWAFGGSEIHHTV
ncbi:class III extradiol ring-cleavage dioxygenase [Paenibacillus sp. JX-17]|uniref:Class III extradiol ring-cleavage dioxygenase n=1 Tax=Paenibacillus lacisoli TaxID=3064525 RepID=A0ABT9CFZ1_9BACL|nr:class III extradiol ring-cleavage dioxygenase [Paenibacillus sp. JX-17]MDO7907554.1 class III extradiol ring-cleavage dioxygenase [Paenibacillus sp. JX-17]